MDFPFFIGLAAGGVAASVILIISHQKTDRMTKQTLLKALALIAAAQATAETERVENAKLQNQIAAFKEDHDLVNDEEVNQALGVVLRAAQTAPPSADATHAASVTAEFLDADGDGKDDATGKTADELRDSGGSKTPQTNFNPDGSPVVPEQTSTTPDGNTLPQ